MSDQPAIDRATAEFYAAKKAARAQRQAFRHSSEAGFVRTMQHAIQQFLDARSQGVSREDACKGLEAELRGAWPKAPSKFSPDCSECDGTGWHEHTCWSEQRCGRERCARQHPAWEHVYVTPCGCVRGDSHRQRVAAVEDALTAAGRTQRRKKASWRQVGS